MLFPNLILQPTMRPASSKKFPFENFCLIELKNSSVSTGSSKRFCFDKREALYEFTFEIYDFNKMINFFELSRIATTNHFIIFFPFLFSLNTQTKVSSSGEL